MKDKDVSNLQNQPTDSISVDFIAILSKVVEDNDDLQKRLDVLEKFNLLRRVEALERSFKFFKIAQHENEALHKSMKLLISMLEGSELYKRCTESKKEYRSSENQVPEHPTSEKRPHHASCKRFKMSDERMKSASCTNYRDNSSHEGRLSPNRQKYSDRHSKSFSKQVKHADTEHVDRYGDHYSRGSYEIGRSSRERSRLDISQRSSTHYDSKPTEERHRIVQRLNTSFELRKRPEREEGQSYDVGPRENLKDSRQPVDDTRPRLLKDPKLPIAAEESRPRLVKDSKPQPVGSRPREMTDPQLPDYHRIRENRDSKQFSSCRSRESEESKQRADYRMKEEKESRQPSHSRLRENNEPKQPSECRTKENNKFKLINGGQMNENNESTSAIDSRIKENKEFKRRSDYLTKENNESKQASDCPTRENRPSKLPNDSRTRENREFKEPSDSNLSEGELPNDDHLPENEDLKDNTRNRSENKSDCPVDPRLGHSRVPKVDIPCPMMPVWGTTGEIDLKKIHSTPMKFLSGLPTFMNYSMISPLPTTPDQLKEKFKEQETIKVSPMPSFMNDELFEEEKPAIRPKEESKVTVQIQPPEKQDVVEVQTITETDDVEHGVFKRRRRAR